MSSTAWLEKYFSVQVFFIIFRETVETVIIVSVLLAFLNQGFGEKSLRDNRVIDEEGNPTSQEPLDEESESTPLTSSSIAAEPSSATSLNSPTSSSQNTISQVNQQLEQNAQLTSNSEKIYRRLVLQVWVGAFLGLLICIIIGSFFVFAFYHLGQDLWGATEKIWEATFSIIASLIITFMGAAMLRVNKMREKWRVKIARAIIETHQGKGTWGIKYLSRKYAMGLLPFVTTLREGLEAVVFLGGLGANQPASSFPLPAITAIALGSLLGWLMYRTGDHMSIHYFLIVSTCFLYLVAAGLMSRGIWFLELQQFINRVGQDVSEMGSGPGSYDISKSVWHVNCCNPETDGPWMIFNALLGWQNSATYASVSSYILYWVFVSTYFYGLKRREDTGYWPFIPKSYQRKKIDKYSVSAAERRAILSRATALYTQEAADEDTANEEEDQSRQTLLPSYPTQNQQSNGGSARRSHESLNSNTPLIT